ncbi:armadillo-type protein [Sphaerosporella brunnea]|uniref:Armadillo-type protein n=1 Tax=Sphaerosporella brunnea TaxID=1250544 RepID=A0A5J5EW68_9PEZI|nr:armadillo-type protein [Sphaerosporella brunnea]
MGKAAKKFKKSDARKAADPIGARPKKPAFVATPQTDALHKSKILPTVKSLASASATDRAAAMLTCNELLRDDTCRFMLLKERIVAKLMEDLVHDSSEDVVVLAWSALCRIAREEGYDQSVNMFRKDILSRIKTVLEKLFGSIGSVVVDPSKSDANTARNFWTLTESIIGLLKCLSEESEQALDAISKMNIVPFLMGLLRPSINVPESIRSIVAQCLSSLTEDNDDLTSKIIEEQAHYVPQLIQLKEDKSPVIRMSACAILHNLSLAPTEIETDLIDAQLLPTLTSFIKHTAVLDFSSYNPAETSPEDQAGLRAAQIALEVVASVATSAGYELDGAEPEANPDPEFIGGVESGDEDDEMADDIAELREDMDMTTVEDHSDLYSGVDKILQYLLETTTPAVILLSKPTLPTSLSHIQLRALAALNNIAWTLDAAVASRSRLSSKWRNHAQTIWNVVIEPVISGNTADITLADAVTGVAWAVAKAAGGNLEVQGVALHKSFISLYRAATTDELRTKCVGVLGCLALPEEKLEVNKDIGIFLVGLLNASPNTPAQPAIEAMNSIMDIYSDAVFQYDRPVFVELGFLQYLETAAPKIRTLIRRIDRKKFPELRERADEAGNNLTRFIAYKKKEQNKQQQQQ